MYIAAEVIISFIFNPLFSGKFTHWRCKFILEAANQEIKGKPFCIKPLCLIIRRQEKQFNGKVLKKVRPYLYSRSHNYDCQQPSQILGFCLFPDKASKLRSRNGPDKERHNHQKRHLPCCDLPDKSC